MSDQLGPEDLHEARVLLTDLLEAVSAQENTLAGGEELGTGGEALQGLLETEFTLSIGNPRNELRRLSTSLSKKVRVPLNPVQKEQMDTQQFDFYYMTLTVSVVPKRGTRFTRMSCSLNFEPKGAHEPIVHSIFPTSKAKEILSLGVALDLVLGGNLDIDFDLSKLTPVQIQQLPLHLQAKAFSKDRIKAYMKLPDYSFKLGSAEIVAKGQGESDCFWSFEKLNVQEVQTVEFIVVFKVLPNIRTFDLTACAAAEPNINWLVNCLRGVFKYLNKKQQALLSRKDETRDNKERFPVGKCEKWTLELPR